MKNNSVEAVGVDGIERAEASVKRKSSKTVSVITASVVAAVVILQRHGFLVEVNACQ